MCKTSQNSEDLRHNCTLPTGRYHSAHKHKIETEMGFECIHLVQTGPVDSEVPGTQGFPSSFLPADVFRHTTLHYASQSKALITSKGYHIPVNRMVWRGMQYSTGNEEGLCHGPSVCGRRTVQLLTVPQHCLQFAHRKENPQTNRT